MIKDLIFFYVLITISLSSYLSLGSPWPDTQRGERRSSGKDGRFWTVTSDNVSVPETLKISLQDKHVIFSFILNFQFIVQNPLNGYFNTDKTHNKLFGEKNLVWSIRCFVRSFLRSFSFFVLSFPLSFFSILETKY